MIVSACFSTFFDLHGSSYNRTMSLSVSTDLFDFKFQVALATSRAVPGKSSTIEQRIATYQIATAQSLAAFDEAYAAAKTVWLEVNQLVDMGGHAELDLDIVGDRFREDLRSMARSLDSLVKDCNRLARRPVLAEYSEKLQLMASHGLEARVKMQELASDIESDWFPPIDQQRLAIARQQIRDGETTSISKLIADLDAE